LIESINMIHGTQIKMARAALDWSIRDLASGAGVSPGTIVRVEHGREAFGSTLERIELCLQDAGVKFDRYERGLGVIVGLPSL
jgi:transcriptional regulator with XRE-family HTH domain